jgi:hypothetical protein
MNGPTDTEIKRLKEELARSREEIANIEKLAGREIDRRFSTDVVDLSEKELEPFVTQTIEEIKGRAPLKPDPESFTSHRHLLGRFVLGLKRKYIRMTRFYTDPILERQEQFNRQALDLELASLSRLRRLNDRLRDVEARLGRCEEELTIIRNRMNEEGKSRTSRE